MDLNDMNGFWPVFFAGLLGPLLVELIKLAAWRDVEKMRTKYSQPLYWIGTAALFVVAGIVVVINGVEHVKILHAVQLGINAPAIVAGYANASVARKKLKANFIGALSTQNPPTKGLMQRMTELLAW